MDQLLSFTDANEDQLNQLLAGKDAGVPTRWPDARRILRVSNDSFGVISTDAQATSSTVRPIGLVVSENQRQRLFGRISQLRSDLSPLSAWLHILSPQMLETMDEPVRRADLVDLGASWAGLVVAEATLGARRPTAQLKMVSCLSTQSFAVARSLALWPRVGLEEVLSRFDEARSIIGVREAPAAKIRSALAPIWGALITASFGSVLSNDSFSTSAFMVLRDLRASGRSIGDEASILARSLRGPDEINVLYDLDRLSPEKRVSAFDHVTGAIRALPKSAAREADLLSFVAGYIVTKAAGGGASLALAAELADEMPAITAWAHVIGGLGETVTWTSSFEGLGRLVSREMFRSFRIDEGPSSDFSIDEARYLVDRQLSDPLVHLKVKQSRSATVSLLPGVDIVVPFASQPSESANVAHSQPKVSTESLVPSSIANALAEMLWPQIEQRVYRIVERSRSATQSKSARARGGSRPKSEPKLPLDDQD